ncbi:LexA family protein [Vreelandella massiliensis]|uniref:LexA family protein n=1 Tax=Vreelandella massiliensis TaxID=1816686 RepID=UPI00096A6211|nr:translesion error-prone DNA polymerase V autoproteolytic subunit [Halomonas massiliensis]
MQTLACVVGGAAFDNSTTMSPLLGCAVRAGFPSPADDHLDSELNLHRYVVKRPAATFFVRAEGDSMVGDGIYHGDLLVVDRSLEAMPGRIIIVALEGELTVKRLERVDDNLHLVASNPKFAPITLEDKDAHVWGVVTHVVHSLPGASP